jgi:hypothetical protein
MPTTRSETEEPGHSVQPKRMRSLNMKFLTQSITVEGKKLKNHPSAINTFEGITYILQSTGNILEAWNLTEGTLLGEIKLPVIAAGEKTMMNWKGFVFERRNANSVEISDEPVRTMVANFSSDSLFLHLMTEEVAFGSQIWSFRVVTDDNKMPSELFSLPTCLLAPFVLKAGKM